MAVVEALDNGKSIRETRDADTAVVVRLAENPFNWQIFQKNFKKMINLLFLCQINHFSSLFTGIFIIMLVGLNSCQRKCRRGKVLVLLEQSSHGIFLWCYWFGRWIFVSIDRINPIWSNYDIVQIHHMMYPVHHIMHPVHHIMDRGVRDAWGIGGQPVGAGGAAAPPH